MSQLDLAWLKGQISDTTYLRSLVVGGLLPYQAVERLQSLRDQP